MRVVGLTGGIACGKSTVVSILKENGGFPIIDCDELAHSVTAVGTPAYSAIVEKFGASICRADNGGEIDRDKLGRIVFGDRDARAWLNGVTHWRIGVAIAKRVLWHWMIRGDRVVILDAPLLFESGLQRIAHPIVCVSLLPQTQLERLMARDKIDGAFARAKIDAQMDTATKCARSQYVVENDGSREETRKRVLQVIVLLQRLQPGYWTRLNVGLVVGLLVLIARWMWF